MDNCVWREGREIIFPWEKRATFPYTYWLIQCCQKIPWFTHVLHFSKSLGCVTSLILITNLVTCLQPMFLFRFYTWSWNWESEFGIWTQVSCFFSILCNLIPLLPLAPRFPIFLFCSVFLGWKTKSYPSLCTGFWGSNEIKESGQVTRHTTIYCWYANYMTHFKLFYMKHFNLLQSTTNI